MYCQDTINGTLLVVISETVRPRWRMNRRSTASFEVDNGSRARASRVKRRLSFLAEVSRRLPWPLLKSQRRGTKPPLLREVDLLYDASGCLPPRRYARLGGDPAVALHVCMGGGTTFSSGFGLETATTCSSVAFSHKPREEHLASEPNRLRVVAEWGERVNRGRAPAQGRGV